MPKQKSTQDPALHIIAKLSPSIQQTILRFCFPVTHFSLTIQAAGSGEVVARNWVQPGEFGEDLYDQYQTLYVDRTLTTPLKADQCFRTQLTGPVLWFVHEPRYSWGRGWFGNHLVSFILHEPHYISATVMISNFEFKGHATINEYKQLLEPLELFFPCRFNWNLIRIKRNLHGPLKIRILGQKRYQIKP